MGQVTSNKKDCEGLGSSKSATSFSIPRKIRSYHKGFENYSCLSESNKRLFVQAIENPTVFLAAPSLEEECEDVDFELPPIEELRRSEELGNTTCADCSDASSTWASLTFGVFLCPLCVGAHRALGTDVSFTQSTILDEKCWTPNVVENFKAKGGNNAVNRELEYRVPDSVLKPATGIPSKLRLEYIRKKYIEREFTKDKTLSEPRKPEFWREKQLAHTSSLVYGKVGYVGILNITVLGAKGLSSSSQLHKAVAKTTQAPPINPYVVLQLGNQQVSTSWKKHATHPVWNEGPSQNLRLSIPWNGIDNLFVSCWSKEHVIKDKLLGRAILNISGLTKLKTDKEHSSSFNMWIDLYKLKVKFPCTCKKHDDGDEKQEIQGETSEPNAFSLLSKPANIINPLKLRDNVSAATSTVKKVLQHAEEKHRCARCKNTELVLTGMLQLQFELLSLSDN